MKNNDAEAIAKEYFRNYFENRVIPKEIAQNLTTSMSNNGKDYIVEVEYFDKTKIAQIDETLFKTFPDVMVTIRVDRETGEVTLIESPNIKW